MSSSLSQHHRGESPSRIGWVGVVVALSVAVGGIVAHQVRPQFFNLGFWQLLFANLIGVLVGGYLALWANRTASHVQEQRRREHERDKEQERAVQAVGALKRTVEHNKDEIDDLLESLQEHPAQPVFSTADPQAFDPVLIRLVETVNDLHLIRESATFRHQLEEFNRMAEAQLELSIQAQSGALPKQEAEGVGGILPTVIDKTKRYGRRLSKAAEKLIERAEGAEDRLLENG